MEDKPDIVRIKLDQDHRLSLYTHLTLPTIYSV